MPDWWNCVLEQEHATKRRSNELERGWHAARSSLQLATPVVAVLVTG